MQRLACLIVLISFAACRKAEPSAATDAAPISASAVPLASSAPSPERTVPIPSGKPLGATLGDMLVNERESRPTGTPRGEDVFALFGKNGVAVQDAKQHLGAPVGARYCTGGTTESGLSMSVCEYVDAAAAEAGKTMSAKAFEKIPNREIAIKKSTTLTILGTASPASAAESKKLFDLFAKM